MTFLLSRVATPAAVVDVPDWKMVCVGKALTSVCRSLRWVSCRRIMSNILRRERMFLTMLLFLLLLFGEKPHRL